jgi:hypothetical protein
MKRIASSGTKRLKKSLSMILYGYAHPGPVGAQYPGWLAECFRTCGACYHIRATSFRIYCGLFQVCAVFVPLGTAWQTRQYCQGFLEVPGVSFIK